MANRPKVTVSLGNTVIEWLRSKVAAGEEPSIGWVIEGLVMREMKKEKNKKAMHEM
jgi:Arc/MetJ-type ribon-helix-helix transcriptional regulator